jgi:cold shock CspA family protein
MKGKIINFYPDKGFGFIKGEDNKKYFFHISDVINPGNIDINLNVEFKEKKVDKHLNASDIVISTPSTKKDKFLKIDRLRIRASDLKEYELISKKAYDKFWKRYYTYYALKITTYTSGIKILEYNYYNYDDCRKQPSSHRNEYYNKIRQKSYEKAQKWLNYIDKEMDKFFL